ncbi:MAG: F0F1 ATP synthase subunit A [bacterium]|jgi:F-type H+-transporting ATPase subunit a
MLWIVPGLAIAAIGWQMRRRETQIPKKEAGGKLYKIFSIALMIAGSWLVAVNLLALTSGAPAGDKLSVEIMPERVSFLGMDVSVTILCSWAMMLLTIAAAVIIRLTVIPRMAKKPHGVQNVLETAIEAIQKYAASKTKVRSDFLYAYVFTIGATMLGFLLAEFAGARSPMSDITFTMMLAIFTLIVVNYFGIREKKLSGRFKDIATPLFIFPIRVINDLSLPVSMGCRLFGNITSGTIVMNLIYAALGGSALGIPSIPALYFTVFAGAIQTFIFITLTLVYVGEATD